MIHRRTLLGLAPTAMLSCARSDSAYFGKTVPFPNRAGSYTPSAAKWRALILRNRRVAGSTTSFLHCLKASFIPIPNVPSRSRHSQLTTTFHRTRRSSPSICGGILILADIALPTRIRSAMSTHVESERPRIARRRGGVMEH